MSEENKIAVQLAARIKRFVPNMTLPDTILGQKRKAYNVSGSSSSKVVVDLTSDVTPPFPFSNTSSSSSSSSRNLNDSIIHGENQNASDKHCASDEQYAKNLQADIYLQADIDRADERNNKSTNGILVEKPNTNWNAIYDAIIAKLKLEVDEINSCDEVLISELLDQMDELLENKKITKKIVSHLIGHLKLRGNKSSILLNFYLATSIKDILGQSIKNKFSFSVYFPAFEELMYALSNLRACEAEKYGNKQTRYKVIARQWLLGHFSWWYRKAIERHKKKQHWKDILRGLTQVGFLFSEEDLQNSQIKNVEEVFSNDEAGVYCMYLIDPDDNEKKLQWGGSGLGLGIVEYD